MELTMACEICGKEKPLSKFPKYSRYIEAETEKEVHICMECE